MIQKKYSSLLFSIIIIAVTFVSRKTVYFYAYCVFGVDRYEALPDLTQSAIIQTTGLLLPVLMVWSFNKFSLKLLVNDLGISKGFLPGFLCAMLFVSPMFIGNLFFSPIRSEYSFDEIYYLSIWPGFNEELVFRSILIGQLLKRGNWGFIPASILSSLYFAIGHLAQSHDVLSAIEIFFITGIAGVGFAFIFIEWGWNLWLPICVHTFMNLHTIFFNTGETAALNITGNIFRGLTIALIVYFTIKRIKKNGSALKGKLLWNYN